MKRYRHGICALSALLLERVAPSAAHAICDVNTLTSVSPATASTGTYTYPTAPVAQAVSFTIVVRYSALLGDACTIALTFRRPTLPASMLLTAGSTTLPYTVTSASSGGNTLLITGGNPAAANRIEASFNAPLLAVNATATLNVTAYFTMQPAASQQAGSYADPTLTAQVFKVAGAVTLLGSQAVSVTGAVAKVCTIGGVATPANDTATVPITAAGAVTTAAIVRSYANAACNTPSRLQLTSQSGGVLRSGAPPAGFTNVINYSASAGFASATATLNTATTAGAVGPESGTAVPTSGTTPSGTLSLTITPQATTLPLISGSYSDTLRITITPQ